MKFFNLRVNIICSFIFVFCCFHAYDAKSAAAAAAVPASSKKPSSHVWSRDFEKFTASSTEEKRGMESLSVMIKMAAEEDAVKIRAYISERPKTDTQNIALVSIIEVDERNHLSKKDIPRDIFVSGWNMTTTGLNGREELLAKCFKIDPNTQSHFLGNYYPDIKESDIQEKLIKDASLMTLKNAFEERGRAFNPEKKFGTANYAHSEQAFIFHVLSGELNQGTKKPKIVIILITSLLPACTICGPTLRNLLEDKEFKSKFLKKLYPKADSSTTKLHIVYAACNLPIIPVVEFNSEDYFYIETRI